MCPHVRHQRYKKLVVDFLKILLKDLDEVERIWNHPDLIFHDFNERLSHFDFETLTTRETKKYKGILFCRHSSKMEILIRPHYYYNDNLHNANDFTAYDCAETLKNVLESFKIVDLKKYQVVNIEFGLNYLFPNYGKDLIPYTEYWKKNQFYTDNELPYSKRSYRTNPNGRANTYKIIKMYCKGIQHPNHCDPNTLRFEIKSKQSKYISKLGINDIGDCLLSGVYKTMCTEIIQATKEVLILDHQVKSDLLTTRERSKLKDYLNTNTWYMVREKSANVFWQMKQRYFGLLDKCGRNIHIELTDTISQKLEKLIMDPFEKRLNSTSLNSFKNTEKRLNSTVCIIGKSTHLDYGHSLCQVTGLKLEHENADAKYIRTSTLRHLQQNDKAKFEQLRRELFANIKIKRPRHEGTLIAHMAKQIRNRHYNGNRFKSTEITPNVKKKAPHTLLGKAISKEKYLANNNLVMLYLQTKGINVHRYDSFVRKVRTIISFRYKYNSLFFVQVDRIRASLSNDFNVQVPREKLIDLINQSRKLKRKPIYIEDQSTKIY